MTLPAFLLGVLISTLCGLVFHFIFGGNFQRLALYVAVGWIGFWGGHLLGAAYGWTFLSIGPLNTGLAVLSAAALLGLITILIRLQFSSPDSES
ncbi:MAG: hypothetical protein ACUVRJ_01150 [Candidatus Villigracilaceae bacterium]